MDLAFLISLGPTCVIHMWFSAEDKGDGNLYWERHSCNLNAAEMWVLLQAGVSAIRSKVNQPKLQTWLVGEKTHWLHTVTFCLNLIYIQVIHIFALFDIYFDYILAIILSSPRIRQFCFIFGGWLSACFPSFTRQQSVYQRTGEEVPPFGCFRK